MGGPGSGRPKEPGRLVREAIDSIDITKIFQQLEEWSHGKEVVCPHCLCKTGCYTADTVSLQAAVELLNRRLGKPKQQVDIDVTTTIQLDASQLQAVIERNLLAHQPLALPAPTIEP